MPILDFGLSGGGGGTPGGLTTQIQFNDAGSFGGDADLAWNKTTNVLTLAGTLRLTDTDLVRGAAAGQLTLSSGSASPSFRLQNGSNAEVGAIYWTSNNFVIGTQGGVSGGTALDTILGSALGARNGLYFATEETSRWQVTSSGHLRPFATATYDLGDASHVLRDVYATLTHATGLPLTTGVTGMLPAANGGTGVANTGTITLGGNLTTSGAFATTLTVTNTTAVTLPTTGTLATLAGAEAFSNKTGNISQWTNDSGYLTSVTAHNVLSATHGDTLAASVVRGDLIIGNSTPKWSRLAIGSASRYLSSDGTDVSWGQVSLTAGVTGVLPAANGGTGVANTSTITLGGNLTTSGAFATTFTMTAATGVTFPTTGTLATLAGSEALTNKTLNGNTFTAGTYTLTGAASKVLTFNHSLTLAGTDSTTMTFPTTSATLARTDATQSFTGNQTFGAQIIVADGSAGTPALIGSDADTGLYFTGSGKTVSFARDGGQTFFIDGNGVWVAGSQTLHAPTIDVGGSSDTFLKRATTASIQMGADVNGAAVSQTFSACNGITGQNKTGGNLTIASGKGTDLGAVSSLIFQTPTVGGATSGVAQSLATRLTLSSAGAVFTGGLTALGGAVFLTTSSALTDGAGAGAGTITNAPAAGNPTKWIGISDNGTTRYIPSW